MQYPLVSICIPTYNGGAYLAEALNSAASQTYPNVEIVISDDASQDDTLSIVYTFKDKTDIPIRVVHHKPNGIGTNWNNCITHAKGVYIKFLFQDDVLYPMCIEEMVAVFNVYPSLGLVACKRNFIVEGVETEAVKNWIATYRNLQRQFEEDEPVTFIDKSLFGREDFMEMPKNKIGEPPTVLFRKSVINEVGLFDQALKQNLDYVFYYRILKKYPIAIINKPLVKFRIHEKQATNINRNQPITDYQIYKKTLYKEFLSLLHPSHKKKLVLRFSIRAQFKKKIISVFRKLRP